MTGQLREIDAPTLKSWLEAGRCVLVDVRETDEHAHERIAGAASRPLSKFDPAALPAADGRTVVLHCASGARSTKAAQLLLQQGAAEAILLKGGIAAWKQAGLPVEAGKGPLPIMRQVQIVAGSLALLGVVLGFAVHPGFFVLSGAVGAGLLQAGLTGNCMMANLLMKLPYNRAK
jgi:rhodanese-related sulfurtransferase